MYYMPYVSCHQEKERGDLLDQYRALSSEAEQFQTATHQLESEGSNMRLEIMTKDSELRRLRDKVDNQEREINEVSSLSCLLSHLYFCFIAFKVFLAHLSTKCSG